MIVTKERFDYTVKGAVNATVDVWEKMQSYLEQAEVEAASGCLGKEIYESLDTYEDAKNKFMDVVSLAAFYNAVPFIDLVLTPTGFGVVSNSNVVPASRERVAALREATIIQRDTAIDLLISILFATCKPWKESELGKVITNTFIWSAEYLRYSGGFPTATRTKLKELRPTISQAEGLIRDKISQGYLDELFQGRRDGTLKSQDVMIYTQAQLAIIYYCRAEMDAFDRHMRFIENTLDNSLDMYPTYAGSKEYQLKHFQHYENKKEDSAFFFAG